MNERRVLESWKTIAAYLGRTEKTCRKWERELGLPIHRLDDSVKAHVYAYADEIDRWKDEMLREIHKHKGSAQKLHWERELLRQNRVGILILRLLVRLFRKPFVAVLAAIILLGIMAAALWYFDRQAKIRWANDIAIPEIERLMVTSEYNKIADLAFKAEKYLPGSPRLSRLVSQVVAVISMETNPAGADVYIDDYSDTEEDWQHIGKSPVRSFRMSQGYKHLKIEKKGYETAEGTWLADTRNKLLVISLDRKGKTPAGMIRVRGGGFSPFIYGISHLGSAKLGDYHLDKNEVINKKYKEFMDAGGYKKKEYWKNAFVKDGGVVPWEDAMREFVDRTGRPGPATWELGDYPEGQGDYPVSGVSWYEASAYAEFVGKKLPTVFHWNRAAMYDGIYTFTIPFCNLQGKRLAPAGSYKSLGPFGTYDMAGNVKEWCSNDAAGKRLILGGAWNESQYMFVWYDSYPPFFRSDNFGFRCMKIIDGEGDPEEVYDPIKVIPPPDFSQRKPCSDEVFEIIRGEYTYTKSDLNSKIESKQDWSEHTRIEKVSYDDAQGGRALAYLFLPRQGPPPFQAIVYYPGGSAWLLESILDYGTLKNGEIECINKNGRALVFPVLRGAFERKGQPNVRLSPQTWRETLISDYREIARCLDYLEKRSDFDKEKFAYYGLSAGACLGPKDIALEKRFKAAIFVGGGIWANYYSENRYTAETDMINFAPRVKVPVLMQNGRYDCLLPMESGIKGLYSLLGTPEKDKHLLLYETGHSVWLVNEYRKDLLDFLDRYLGPVE